MSLRLSYGTNGFGDHPLPAALDVIAGLGYDGVALTLDHQHLDPFAPGLPARVDAARAMLTERGLGVVVETGARYLLDPWRKHEPTLVSAAGREPRLELTRRAVEIARDLGADVVHLWSGILPAADSPGAGWERLLAGMSELVPHAEAAGVRLAFEPEPGMFIETLADLRELRRRLGSPPTLGATVDVGHLVCIEDESPADCIRGAAGDVLHVQIEDMRRGVHEHLEFGEGELDLPAALGALLEIDYRGLVSVELARHSPTAPATAARSMRALRDALDRLPRSPSPATEEAS
ncbi:sugar phosphate isomerase/epimerase [Pseudactinotalea sp. HY158]|uniref:sugar phosphate isomerase/epimerase family protein n=1 Tax=Pseudactinotalea sp. HY158 TaxID=2654547 RepID=UPI00129C7CC0|nr:sugar phosphate isomerase/epimerase family protein [Pseudactinotalea sp. HY158]QGH70041.1 TIM barrel protein [Pseudactinotalea sp. HY158]